MPTRLWMLAAAVLTVACGAGAPDEPTTGYKLAAVETGSPTATVVATYDRALDGAESKCTQPRERIADMALRGSQLAGERGAETSALDILLGIYESVPPEAAPRDCAEIVSLLVLMMGD
jgi:hypothetical protein